MEVTAKHILFNKEFNEILFERMEAESEFMIACLEDHHILLEEVGTQTNAKTESLWERIKSFFQRLINVFKGKAKSLFESNKEWMDNNFNKLDKINYADLKISALPYWEMPMEKMRDVASAVETKIRSAATNPKSKETYSDMNKLKSELLSNYLDENGDLTIGLKNTYRCGQPKGPIKPVALEGPNLERLVKEFKNYCYNYGKDIEPFIQGLMNKAEKEIKTIEGMIKNIAAKESFCLVENSLYSETELKYCDNFIVLEAEAPAKEEPKKEEPKVLDASKQPTKVEVVNKGDANQKETDDIKQTYSKLNSDQLSFAKNAMQIYQLSISALMTVLEEKFSAYLNALKGIVNEAGKGISNDPGATPKVEGEKKTGVAGAAETVVNKVKDKVKK